MVWPCETELFVLLAFFPVLSHFAQFEAIPAVRPILVL